ncbi:inhibitor of growth protein 3 isoform X1 [Toxorhynchites rutilus septentrionalis]|uniref:inhibitor of growth protein 3 isoform X1 n=1 Tax=Toxorhynchites rutilus septentrionalis TaxID=329112 RepID=UPI00247A5A2C|nr:inhibitor of growth protein 3 isoform X1 [Toxorhynchites rutilus septentrionalis]
MLYLEDYLEMIEHLPQELRDRFTEMREMDLSVQNNMDSLDKRARTLFQQCRRGELVGTQADGEFYAIRKDYYRVLEDSDEKVQLAGQMYDLVDRYLRRLDSELYKFKCELEADHNGITEILEKRSLELDTSTSNGGLNQKENRYFDTLGGISSSIVASSAARVDNRYKIKPEKRRDSIGVTALSGPPPEKRQAVAASASAISSGPPVRPTTPLAATGGPYHMLASTAASSTPNAAATSVAYNLQQFGAGNAIAAAASQAIAATQQMQQGRRTASLKASYEAIHGAGATGTAAHDLLINRELAGATHNALQAVERETSNAFSNQQRRQHKKKLTTGTSAAATLLQVHQKQQQQQHHHPQQQQQQQPQQHHQHSTILNPNLSSSSLDLLEPPTVPGVLSAVASGSSTSSLSGTSSSAGPSNSSGSIGGVGGGGGVGSSVSGGGATLPPLGTGIVLNENGMVVEQTPEGEWTYDPNEPRYCICNQVSYGDMVACDNEDCPFEWFHYPCVNITSSPKGKWYCPQCSSSMKRRASRKN